jgi:hypothetical protein
MEKSAMSLVDIPGAQLVEQLAEHDVFDLELDVQVGGDGLGDVDIDADHLAFQLGQQVEFVGRVIGAGADDDPAGGLDPIELPGLLLDLLGLHAAARLPEKAEQAEGQERPHGSPCGPDDFVRHRNLPGKRDELTLANRLFFVKFAENRHPR